jgi:hypothetical protein
LARRKQALTFSSLLSVPDHDTGEVSKMITRIWHGATSASESDECWMW